MHWTGIKTFTIVESKEAEVICIRCGIAKKLVRREGNPFGCIVYNQQVAKNHRYQITKDSSN